MCSGSPALPSGNPPQARCGARAAFFAGWAPQEKFKPCSSENGDYFTQHIVFPTFYYQNKLLGVALSERLGKRP